MLLDIARQRLRNQSLTENRFKQPHELVRWLGAVQAQDFAAAKWALGLRMAHETDQSIEEAFNRGEILRTHVMRPTWHFVAPENIRWLLALTSPRVHAFNGYYYRQSGLDKDAFRKSNKVLEKALQGGKQLTRNELRSALQHARIPAENLRLTYIMMQAELDGIICSGPRRAKQFTYMLLDERVPQGKSRGREEALATLTKRYFSSHGPAQVQDFVWWSGLTASDAKRGLEMNKAHLTHYVIDGKTYWHSPSAGVGRNKPTVFLIPAFDEYYNAYKDRSAVLDSKYSREFNLGGTMVNGTIVMDGRIIGGWKRTLGDGTVTIAPRVFEEVTDRQQQGIVAAAKRYGRFLGLPIILKQT